MKRTITFQPDRDVEIILRSADLSAEQLSKLLNDIVRDQHAGMALSIALTDKQKAEARIRRLSPMVPWAPASGKTGGQISRVLKRLRLTDSSRKSATPINITSPASRSGFSSPR